VWASPDGLQAFAVGDLGTILHFEHGKWSSMSGVTTQNLRGVGGVCSCTVYAVGESGTVLKYDGSDWSDFSPGVPANFNAIWIDHDSGNGFLAGEGGTVMKLENGAWSPLSLGSITDDFLSVWGSSLDNVYFVSAQSSAFKWNGTQFKVVSISPGSIYVFHGVFGTGPDDVYVASELLGTPPPPFGAGSAPAALHAGGSIFHWDGMVWTPVFTDPVHDCLSVWRANDHAGFATGDSGSLLEEASGNGWVRIFDVKNLPFYVHSVWGSSMKNVFIVGDDGAIVRYSP
jgi:hypothetical protein